MIGSRESWISCPWKPCQSLKYQLKRIRLILLKSSLRSWGSFGNYLKTWLFVHLFPWQWIFQEYDSITKFVPFYLKSIHPFVTWPYSELRSTWPRCWFLNEAECFHLIFLIFVCLFESTDDFSPLSIAVFCQFLISRLQPVLEVTWLITNYGLEHLALVYQLFLG